MSTITIRTTQTSVQEGGLSTFIREQYGGSTGPIAVEVKTWETDSFDSQLTASEDTHTVESERGSRVAKLHALTFVDGTTESSTQTRVSRTRTAMSCAMGQLSLVGCSRLTEVLERRGTPEGGDGEPYLHRDTVRLLRDWLSASGIADRPLFRSVRKGGPVGARLDATQVPRTYRAMAERAGPSPRIVRRISGHSPRVGAAQDMIASDVEMAAIMQVGRWKTAPHGAALRRRAARAAPETPTFRVSEGQDGCLMTPIGYLSTPTRLLSIMPVITHSDEPERLKSHPSRTRGEA